MRVLLLVGNGQLTGWKGKTEMRDLEVVEAPTWRRLFAVQKPCVGAEVGSGEVWVMVWLVRKAKLVLVF